MVFSEELCDQDYQQADPSGHWIKQHKVERRRLKIKSVMQDTKGHDYLSMQ